MPLQNNTEILDKLKLFDVGYMVPHNKTFTINENTQAQPNDPIAYYIRLSVSPQILTIYSLMGEDKVRDIYCWSNMSVRAYIENRTSYVNTIEDILADKYGISMKVTFIRGTIDKYMECINNLVRTCSDVGKTLWYKWCNHIFIRGKSVYYHPLYGCYGNINNIYIAFIKYLTKNMVHHFPAYYWFITEKLRNPPHISLSQSQKFSHLIIN